MIASPPAKMNHLRNARLKAERDRQFSATAAKMRRLTALGGIATVLAAGSFWFYGCSFSDGCATTPMAELQMEVVGDLVPGS